MKSPLLSLMIAQAAVVGFNVAASGSPRTNMELNRQAAQWMDGHPVMGTEPKTITRLETVENTNDTLKIAHLAPQGYLILNVDDQRPLVAGFSPNQQFAPNSGEFTLIENNLQAYAAKPVKPRNQSTPKFSAASAGDIYIPALVKTKWFQWEPFNNRMPAHNRPKAFRPKSPTGCGTIAYAQLLNYHQWPPYGQGKLSYTDGQGDFQPTFTTNFARKYQWKNLPEYFTWETMDIPAADEVSKLALDMAVAGNADCEIDVSAINLLETSKNMVKHLFYERSQEWVWGDAASRIAIQKSLRNKLPVPADITIDAEGNGHAILFDGLLIKNRRVSYHTNYGWGGVNNIWWDEDAIIDVWQCQPGIQPGLSPLPPKNTHTIEKKSTWELPWKIPAQRTGEINRITLYQEVNRNTTWSDTGNELPEEARSWSISPNGYSGNCWYANGPYPEEILNLTEEFTPTTGSALSFQEKHVCGMDAMTIEATTDGENCEGLCTYGADIQHNWTNRTIQLSKFAGKKIRIRFRYGTPPLSWYYSQEQGGGMWIDNLTITNATLTTWEKLPMTGELVSINGQECISRHQSRGALPTGTYKLRASLTDNDGVEHAKGPVVSVNVMDKLPMAKLRVNSGGRTKQSGDSLGFGTVKSGKTATRTLVIKNTGNLPLKNIRIAMDGAHPGDFKITKPKHILSPGTQSTVRITFRPGKTGQRTASIRITADTGSITLKARGRGDG